MLAEKIARDLLAHQGLEVIWKLHADAATLDRIGNQTAAESLLEIADAAERASIDGCGVGD
jgi:hypothetical protein